MNRLLKRRFVIRSRNSTAAHSLADPKPSNRSGRPVDHRAGNQQATCFFLRLSFTAIHFAEDRNTVKTIPHEIRCLRPAIPAQAAASVNIGRSPNRFPQRKKMCCRVDLRYPAATKLCPCWKDPSASLDPDDKYPQHAPPAMLRGISLPAPTALFSRSGADILSANDTLEVACAGNLRGRPRPWSATIH